MQRLNAAPCLLFALLAGVVPCHSKDRLLVEVVQTHTGVRLGTSEREISIKADQALTGCNGKSGTYTRELGFYCGDAGFPVSQEPAESRRGYAFFYDVRVIMPDQAHLVFHCSTVLDRACQGFPAYPENTTVVCSDFAHSGTVYKDCTASGPSAASIGMYRAALHGDRMTIFGSHWRRSYLHHGTWQWRAVAAVDRKPSPPTTEATLRAGDPPAPSPESGCNPCQDDEPAKPQETKPPAQEEKPTPAQETKPTPPPEDKPAQSQETKPAPAQETKPAPPQEDKPAPVQETKPTPPQEEKPAQPQETKPADTQEANPTLTPPQETKPAPAPESQTPQGPAPGQDASNTSAAPTAPSPAAGPDLTIDPQVIEQAKAGDPTAQYKLGYDYYLGRGVPADFVQAAIWWKKAADQGFPDAQNNLGVLYNSGKGVPQSFSEAYFWQNLAAARAKPSQQAQFAKNRDDSAARLWLFERLRVQKRAAKWATDHPVPPRSHEPKPDQK
jgi:hypothetical protein